jgi:hypothetical protein
MSSSVWTIWAVEGDGPLKPKNLELLSPEILGASAVLVAVLIAGAILFAFLQRWKKKQLADEDLEISNVTSYRAMLESGELSREEYDRILKRVGKRVLGKSVPEPLPPQVPPKDSEPPQPNQ